jgi:hypothetical protein
MGKTYHFECPYCQYRARVSGGADSGQHCEVQTVVCRDCRELLDVFTRRRSPETPSPSRFPGWFRSEIPPVILADQAGKRKLVWESYSPACPLDARHTVEPWKDPGRCPRCGNFMEKNGLPYRSWD